MLHVINNSISPGKWLQLKDTTQDYCPWNGLDDRQNAGTADFIIFPTLLMKWEPRLSYVRFFRSFQTKHSSSVFKIIKNDLCPYP